jgi:hypothetical protein
MNEQATRHNEGKLRMSLIDFDALEPLVQALEYGAKKYGKDNWKKGLPEDELMDSLLRHVTALSDGEIFDEGSNVHHIGHIMANAMFISYQNRHAPKVKQADIPIDWKETAAVINEPEENNRMTMHGKLYDFFKSELNTIGKESCFIDEAFLYTIVWKDANRYDWYVRRRYDTTSFDKGTEFHLSTTVARVVESATKFGHISEELDFLGMQYEKMEWVDEIIGHMKEKSIYFGNYRYQIRWNTSTGTFMGNIGTIKPYEVIYMTNSSVIVEDIMNELEEKRKTLRMEVADE